MSREKPDSRMLPRIEPTSNVLSFVFKDFLGSFGTSWVPPLSFLGFEMYPFVGIGLFNLHNKVTTNGPRGGLRRPTIPFIFNAMGSHRST
jgi:hypothetical protein